MDLIKRDLKHIWHPCTQMKDCETFPPVAIVGAEGSYIHLKNGKRLIDASSSWWCKHLGHQHPRLKQALCQQANQFEHVIFGNTTYETIVQLSEQLTQLSPNLNKISYASDGSSAVEIALKMSVHARKILGESHRHYFMALQNSYHGETGLALAVSDLGIYREPYNAVLCPVNFLQDIPYVTSIHDPLWHDCSAIWPSIQKQLDLHAENLTAIIIEPILQASGGMQIYSQDFLVRLRQWTKANNIHLIADEIMTGLGRTGTPLACYHANIEPDFLCLGKGLTAGWLPMSAALTSQTIYDIFYDDYEKNKSFLHSHTHSGNALAAAVALENLQVMREENIYEHVQTHAKYLHQHLQTVAEMTGKLQRVRSIGFVAAADLISDIPRAGQAVFRAAMEYGALLRPLGNTIYWVPPLNTSRATLDELADITLQAIQKAC